MPLVFCLEFLSSKMGAFPSNLTSIDEHMGSIPGLTQWVKDLALLSRDVGRRRGLDPMLLWLWLGCRVAATGWIRPLAWEFPYRGMAQKEK